MRHTLVLVLVVLLGGCAATEPDPTTDPVIPIDEPEPPALSAPMTSRLLYALAADPEVAGEEERQGDYLDPVAGESAPIGSFAAVDATAVVAPWSSAAGRTQSADILQVGAHATARSALPATSYACIEPQFMTGSDSGTFAGVPTFKSPNRAFASADDARAFLSTVRARIPFYLPFSHPDVRLAQGWIYNSGGSHRGLDFARTGVAVGEDSTFIVRAMAPGRVLMVTYRQGGGNGVFIEHTYPDGTHAISVYYHMRNGHDHDLAQALALTCETTSERCAKYKKFAQNYPDHPSWGTNAQKLLVSIGDEVKAGQALGWAGNTGVGGAAAGLNDDGSPKNWKGNVHLHNYFAVESSDPNVYVYVDPFAVYEKTSTGCYDLLANTEFPRLMAPFFSNFHRLPLEVLGHYFGYFSGMGWSLRTLSVHRGDGKLFASGSFQPGIPGKWRARLYLDATGFQSWANTYWAQGMIPRETTVTTGADGKPRFSAIWRPVAAGEHVVHRGQLTDAQWSALWSRLVGDLGYRVADYFGYESGGTPFHLALYTDDEARPFYLYRKASFTQLKDKIAWGFDHGYAPVSLNATEVDGSVRYAVILRRIPGCWRWYVGLTSSRYQSKAASFLGRGYRLEKLQGYANSTRFAALFHIPADQAPAICP